MPSSNPVYQPTTVTYERHKEWSTNYITERVIPGCYQRPQLHRLLLVSSILMAMLGLGLAVYALVNDVNTHKEVDDSGFDTPKFQANSEENYDYGTDTSTGDETETGHDHETNVIVGSIGIALILVSLVMYVVYLQLKGMCRGLLPRHVATRPSNLDGAEQNGHSETSIPTAVTYKGVQQEPTGLNLEPAAPAEEERHSLMDNKFNNEDTERMMDDDPRIVLKPLRTAEEA